MGGAALSFYFFRTHLKSMKNSSGSVQPVVLPIADYALFSIMLNGAILLQSIIF